MADAKKCDRCGKYYEEYHYLFNDVPVQGVRLVPSSMLYYPGNPLLYMDLCSDCMKKLVIFMQHPESVPCKRANVKPMSNIPAEAIIITYVEVESDEKA